MNIQNQARPTISASLLADWIDRRPDSLWIVDGDYRLMRKVNLPCPTDELASALRAHRGSERIEVCESNHRDDDPEPIGWIDIEQVWEASTASPRELLLRWSDQDEPWVLTEFLEEAEEGR